MLNMQCKFVVAKFPLRRLSKESEPADIIIHSEIFLEIFQTCKIQSKSTCILKKDAEL